MNKILIGVTALAMSLTSTAAFAQQSSVKEGGYWTAGRIDVEDGQFENYMDFLTKVWVPNQEYAKSQGWISDYHMLSNVNPRDGEPNIILITRFADHPSVAEQQRRDEIMNARNKWDDHGAQAASGQRTKMRTVMGSILYQELHRR